MYPSCCLLTLNERLSSREFLSCSAALQSIQFSEKTEEEEGKKNELNECQCVG